MPRGRHRHSPPLHRLLPPSAIAGVSVVCALGPWLFTEQLLLRVLAAAAAVTAVVGAVVMRHWDIQAGKQVADLVRARAGDEWRFEERVAELESDLEESRELRAKLEQRLRAKRSELAGLRNEHASLLRRYATAETERATALEGRRLLEIETTVPARALPPARAAQDDAETGKPVGDESAETFPSAESASAAVKAAEVDEAATAEDRRSTEAVEPVEDAADGEVAAVDEAEAADGTDEAHEADEVVAEDTEGTKGTEDDSAEDEHIEAAASDTDAEAEAEEAPAADAEDATETGAKAAGTGAETDGERAETDGAGGDATTVTPAPMASAPPAPPAPSVPSIPTVSPSFLRAGAALDRFDGPGAKRGPSAGAAESGTAGPPRPGGAGSAATGKDAEAAREDEAKGKPEAVDEHARATAVPPDTDEHHTPAEQAAPDPGQAADTPEPRPTGPAGRPAGHFTVPTAVAVVPAAQPVRRPTAEGGFDFFGTQQPSSADPLDAVQNEDLADVVGQEALALHKAESDAEFKPADARARAVGQVIDLTAHDETQQIDVEGLRSAAS